MREGRVQLSTCVFEFSENAIGPLHLSIHKCDLRGTSRIEGCSTRSIYRLSLLADTVCRFIESFSLFDRIPGAFATCYFPFRGVYFGGIKKVW